MTQEFDLKDVFATKEELFRETSTIKNEVSALRTDMYKEFSDIKKESKADFRWIIGIVLTMSGIIISLLVNLLLKMK